MLELPYVTGVMLTVLRADATLTSLGTHIGSLQPADVADRLPYIVAARVPGGSSDANPLLEDKGRAQIDCYADDPRAAVLLGHAAHRALVQARRAATLTPDGALTEVKPLSLPTLLPQSDLPAGVYRAQALYLVAGIKPAT